MGPRAPRDVNDEGPARRDLYEDMHMRGRITQGALVAVAAVWVLGVIGSSDAYAQRGALFVSNYVSGNVSVYGRTANGAVPPARVITDALSGPHQVAINRTTKELIVANNRPSVDGVFSISFYDADVTSATFGALRRTIAGPNTGLLWPLGVIVDVDRQELFVSNDDHAGVGYSVTVYDLKSLANGVANDAAPRRTISGFNTKLSSPAGIAIGPSWDPIPVIFVVNYDFSGKNGGASVAVFPRDADGNVSPMRTIAGPATGLNRPQGIAFDGFSKLYVANSAFDQAAVAGNISVFSVTDQGDVAPSSVLGGNLTQLCHPIQIALDTLAGEVTVAQGGGCQVGVTVHSLNSGLGNIAPIRTVITGTFVGFDPIGVAVIPDEQHLMPNIGPIEANLPGGAIVTFALDPGITSCSPASGSVFDVASTRVACTGSDIFGPLSSGFWVTVVDTTPPVFIGVANLEAEAFTSTEVAWDVTAADRGINVPVVCNPASGSVFFVGTTTVNCSAQPLVGPGASVSFTVTVTRKVAPLPGGACFVVDFREITYFNASAVITSSDADIRTRNGIKGAFNPALWPYRAAGGAGYTKSRGTLFRIYGFAASTFGSLIPNEDMPWITYPVQFDADTNGYYVDLGGPQRVRVCPNQFQDYVLTGKKGNGHRDSSALLPLSQQNVPGIMLARNSQIVKLPTRIKLEMDSLGLAHGIYGKIDYMAFQQQGSGNAQFREFVNVQLSFPGDSPIDRLQHYAFGLLTAFNVNFESFAGCNYVDSSPGNDSVRLVDLWSPNKSTKQGYNVWQACGAREPAVNQKQRENYDVAFNAIQILSTVNGGTDTVHVLFGAIAPLSITDAKRKDLKIDWLDWDKADR